MKGDTSRSTFDAHKHYTGVRMQQGRVLLDSEWNEQNDITRHLDESANVAIIGPSGASRIDGGFAIVAVPGDLILTPGQMWVDGILCECDGGEWLNASVDGADVVELTAWPRDAARLAVGLWLELDGTANGGGTDPVYARIESTNSGARTINFTANHDMAAVTRVRAVYSYATQPHLPVPALTTVTNGIRSLDTNDDFVAYLDVWTRHLTAVEDESIREIALGGPDTTTRTQTIWQVRLDATIDTCADVASPVATSRMLARTAPVAVPTNPCIVPSTAGYRGLANQLYRVEIHRGSGEAGGPTYKWSRDNGAFVFPIEGAVPTQAAQLRLGSLGRDDRFGLKADDWVELIDERLELEGRPGIIARVLTTPAQNNRILSLEPATLPPGTDFNVPANAGIDLTRNPRVRLWSYDAAINNATGENTFTNGVAETLELGVQVIFSGTNFRSGEYWLIPARTAINEETGDIEWPRHEGQPIPLPPRGIEHHHAALADVTTSDPWEVEDCRPLFSPLTAPELFYVSGDGQEVMPDLVTDARVALPFPLKVAAVNGGPIPNATIEFTIVVGNGQFGGGGTTRSVTTGADGIASIVWEVDAATPHQLVRARMLEGNGFDPVNLPPIEFNASISVASQVAYDNANCAELQARNARTVQAALDAFCDILDDPKLHFVGGDGQEAPRGGNTPGRVPASLEVGVANGIRPVQNQTVRFTPSHGGRINNVPGPVNVLTDANGLVSVQWTLDLAGPEPQTATARLIINGNPSGLPVIFKATFAQEGGGVCTFQIAPVAGWEQQLENLDGRDAEICFEIGEFPLDEPLVIRNAGTLKITGGGAGTRIVARKSETAIRFEHCEEVLVRDLSAEAREASTGSNKGLNGVLSFHGCGAVTLEALQLRCASAVERHATCVTVNSVLLGTRPGRPAPTPANPNIRPRRPLAPRLALPAALLARLTRRGTIGRLTANLQQVSSNTIVRISDCAFVVGHAQIGILLVDPIVARIENNVILASTETMPLATIVDNKRGRVPWRRSLVSGLRVSLSPTAPPVQFFPPFPRNVNGLPFQIPGAQRFFVSFRTDVTNMDAWQKFAGEPLPPGTNTNRRIIQYIKDFAETLLLDAARRDQFPGFRDWFTALDDNVPAEPAHGIVVGGTRVGDVQILGNVIRGAAQAIRAGVNSREDRDQNGRIARLEIDRNVIELEDRREIRARHGIHAGKCESLLVENNHVACERQPGFPAGQLRHPVEGIQIIGEDFGRMMGVQANEVQNCDLVINIDSPHVNPDVPGSGVQWFATDNLVAFGTAEIVQPVRTNPPNVVVT